VAPVTIAIASVICRRGRRRRIVVTVSISGLAGGGSYHCADGEAADGGDSVRSGSRVAAIALAIARTTVGPVTPSSSIFELSGSQVSADSHALVGLR
jgi:hypothetical protein